jgi:hypothetical protein
MIKGIHAMFYSPQAEELRSFLRDKLGLPFFDAGQGWLIFTPSEAEIGCHPDESVRQEISLYCDDIEKTVEELTAKGVTFTGPVEDHGYGLVTFALAPGDLKIQLYQPRYK